MFIKSILFILAGSFFLFAGLRPFFSGGHGRHSGKFAEKRATRMVGWISKELELREDQKVKLEAIKTGMLARRQEFRSGRGEVKEALLAQLNKEQIDEPALNELFAGKEQAFRDMRGELISRLAEFHATLSPEQREKLAGKLEKFQKCHENSNR